MAKYADGMLLYRLDNILKRYGREITRTAMKRVSKYSKNQGKIPRGISRCGCCVEDRPIIPLSAFTTTQREVARWSNACLNTTAGTTSSAAITLSTSSPVVIKILCNWTAGIMRGASSKRRKKTLPKKKLKGHRSSVWWRCR